MTRKDLLLDDQYIKDRVENIIVSGKPIGKMRDELSKFFISLRNELMDNDPKKPWEVGDRVRITKQVGGHNFENNEKVVIAKIEDTPDGYSYLASNGKTFWWIDDTEGIRI